ncbi:MAG: hypothetical protein JWM80_5842 [Cyanobacteria bacterium RYN_339]|nr:hypothetical protein [Cyanobacteria bacterium RYN_339]
MGNPNQPVATAVMLLRRPVEVVYDAFANPETTTKFWFTKSTGRLEAGKTVVWSWEMYGVSVPVSVVAAEPGKRIVVSWGEAGAQTEVEWTFRDLGELGTYVRVVNSGFAGTPEEIVAKVNDAAGGFNLLLAGAKAWLEHGVQLNLVADHVPEAVRS